MVIPWNIYIFKTTKLSKWPTKVVWPAFIIDTHDFWTRRKEENLPNLQRTRKLLIREKTVQPMKTVKTESEDRGAQKKASKQQIAEVKN
jgi:hypothetical protein